MRAGQRSGFRPVDSGLSGLRSAHARTHRFFAALTFLLWLLPFCLQGSIITNNNTALVFFSSSYDTSPYHYFGDYVGSWVALGHPQFTNHWSSASRSGGNLEEANESRLERLGLAHWESGQRAIGLIMADDNGGFTSNQVQMNLTNTLLSPAYFFNGYAYTNEGGWSSTQSITWVAIGEIPDDSSDGDSGAIARNNAATNLFMSLGLPYVDMWNPLWTGGWSNDNNGAHLLGYYDGGHPYASGSLTMGLTIATKLADVDTNVSLATIDFGTAGVVCTNHCVISSISENGNSISFTRHDDRLPMAFDVPDGTITNDCRNAFIAMPQLSNAFWFTIAVTNLPAGNYNVNIDGVPVNTLSSSALAAGWNMFTDWNSNSPYWRQRVAVLALVRLKNGTDPVTLVDHSAGELGPGGWDLVNYDSWSQQFWDEGYRGDALASALNFITTNLNGLDDQISAAAQPSNHVFTIIPVETISFPTPGDQTYGVAPITLNATASSGLPVDYTVVSGPATISSNVLTITGAGEITIQASQPGNGAWAAAAPVTQTINAAPAVTVNAINSSLNPATSGANVTFTVALGPLPSGGATPTGSIVFMDGATPLGTNALDDSGTTVFSTSSLVRGSHTITAEYEGDDNFLGSTNSLSQMIDNQPLAGLVVLQRFAASGTKITISDLLTNASDPDGDLLTLVSVSAGSASDGTISTVGQWVCYQPPTGFTNSDSFSYVVADSLGLQTTGTVAVVMGTDTNAVQNIAGVKYRANYSVIKFNGIQQRTYSIQYTTNLAAPDWQTLGTATAATNGVILFQDNPPPNSPTRYYRTTYP